MLFSLYLWLRDIFSFSLCGFLDFLGQLYIPVDIYGNKLLFFLYIWCTMLHPILWHLFSNKNFTFQKKKRKKKRQDRRMIGSSHRYIWKMKTQGQLGHVISHQSFINNGYEVSVNYFTIVTYTTPTVKRPRMIRKC